MFTFPLKKICFGLILLVLSSNCWGVLLPLTNASFEAPTLDTVNGWYASVDDWWTFPAGQVGTTFDQPWNPSNPGPDGNQYAWANVDGFHLAQQLGLIAADTRYVLAVDLFPLAATPPFRAEIYWEETDDWSAAMVQKVLHPTWDTTREDFELPAGEWTTVYVGFDSADWPGQVGKNMRIRVSGDKLAIDNVRGWVLPNNAGNTYYLSNSQGSDANDGLSDTSPWQSFGWINQIELKPGEQVLLRRGDEWRDELHLSGKGTTAQPIHLADYGPAELDRPKIRRSDVEFDRCAIIDGASHWRIHGMDMGHSKIGLYLRYWQDYENSNVIVYDCYFEDMPDQSADPPKHDYEHAWSTAIFIGGSAGGLPGDPNNARTVIDGVTVTHCEFRGCCHGFGNAWYYPAPYKGRLRNITMTDCTAWDCMNGGFALFNVDGGLVERVRSIGGGGDVWAGTTLGFLQTCANVTVQNCEFAFIDRANSADGCGMDFEGDCNDCVFRDNVVHDCHGSAVISLTTQGINERLEIADNTFYNNSMNSWNNEGAYEMFCGSSLNTGTVSNNGLYCGWNSLGWFSADWSGYTLVNNRQGSFEDVCYRPTWWDWETDGNFQGWSASNDLADLNVIGGALHATSTGEDPYIHSAMTWTPALATRYVWVRMSQTTGTHGQIFWITETHPSWDFMDRSVFFPIIADGEMHDYFIDLVDIPTPSGSPGGKGLITQIRLDPTISSGSEMVIEHVRLVETTNPRQGPPEQRPPWPLQLTVTGETSDNWTLESSESSQTGGSVGNVNDALLRLGDEANNASYRPVMSFDTSSLPDTAQLVDAVLMIRRLSCVNKNPWTYGGSIVDMDYCKIDMAVPYLGADSTVTAGDWEVTEDLNNVGHILYGFNDGLQIWEQLSDPALDLIDPTDNGQAQFRLRFPTATNGDGIADYVNFGSANQASASDRPTLKFNYYASPPTIPVPTAPIELAVTDLTTNQMVLWWTDRSDNEDGFRVWDQGISTNQAANTYTCFLEGLLPDTPHVLAVAAFNTTGQSSLLGPVTVWTLAETPGAPLVSNPTMQTLDVQINAAADLNPGTTEYAIRISPALPAGEWVQSDGSLGEAAHYATEMVWGTVTVSGLEAGFSYSLSARARNGAGVETADGPTTPGNTLNATATPTATHSTPPTNTPTATPTHTGTAPPTPSATPTATATPTDTTVSLIPTPTSEIPSSVEAWQLY